MGLKIWKFQAFYSTGWIQEVNKYVDLFLVLSISYYCFLLQEEFEEYAEKAKTLPETTTNENKLILYGLFKQATVGPVNTSRPGMFNMRERYKWDAWKAVEGKSKEEAMSDYITKVKQLLEEAAASS
ncbi:PREDICTED: acyl-CoA-binding protein isoform X1 [Theobroma cacao]|uniref:Acyl-CoA-binding protein isoform X1 n=2 Tax=Theobroma cacao TaxID=3641 RepID=A0AB32VG41_THECC|nr:PREDICTED: acyl-CoA-binding protein isoform X1 [Theobroma cacao]EOY25438.1 Acyl-CoA-binding protein 6 isoform 1 [Theobroma cacao]